MTAAPWFLRTFTDFLAIFKTDDSPFGDLAREVPTTNGDDWNDDEWMRERIKATGFEPTYLAARAAYEIYRGKHAPSVLRLIAFGGGR